MKKLFRFDIKNFKILKIFVFEQQNIIDHIGHNFCVLIYFSGNITHHFLMSIDQYQYQIIHNVVTTTKKFVIKFIVILLNVVVVENKNFNCSNDLCFTILKRWQFVHVSTKYLISA